MGNFNPKNPTKFRGTDKYITFFVTRPRRPTGADFRQPETGNLYSLGTVWQVGKDPTTGSEGELWMLSKIVASVGYWIQVSSGAPSLGPVLTLSDTAGTLVDPTALGNIQIEGTTNQIVVTSVPLSNKITLSLAGGGQAIDSVAVQATSAPGVTPVVPDTNGLVTVSGAVVAGHSVPLETRSRAVNAYTIEAQVATTVAATPANTNAVGMACYNNAQFTVDATSGMVSLIGSTTAAPILTTTGDDATAVGPTAGGTVNVIGTTVANATHAKPVYVRNSAANTESVDVQLAVAVAATPANSNSAGLACFNNVDFSVDATSGMVSLTGAPPAQVAFIAQLSATVANATGDGTDYTVIFDNAIKNVGSAYNTGTGVFTAPTAGYYLFCGNVCCDNLVTPGQTEGIISLITSTISYKTSQFNPGVVASIVTATYQASFQVNQIVYMAIGATAHIQILIGPGGVGNPKNVNIQLGGATDPRTFFSGALLFEG